MFDDPRAFSVGLVPNAARIRVLLLPAGSKVHSGTPSPHKFGRYSFPSESSSLRILGERGMGGEGKQALIPKRFMRENTANFHASWNQQQIDLLLSPHPPLLVNSETP